MRFRAVMDDRITFSQAATRDPGSDLGADRCKDSAAPHSRCTVCGAALPRANPFSDIHDIAVCDRRECRKSLLGTQPASAQRQITSTLRHRVARIAADTPEGQRGAVSLLPANTRPLAPVTSAMRERFIDTIRARLAQAATAGRDDRAEEWTEEPSDVESSAAAAATADSLLRLGCAVCAGACCTRGGTHAFLGASDLRRIGSSISDAGANADANADANAGANADAGAERAKALEELYAAHIPEMHYEGSCVFHGERGCTLPRPMRSLTCNRYLCGGLSTLRRAIAETASDTAVVGAATWVRLERVAALDASVLPASIRSISGAG